MNDYWWHLPEASLCHSSNASLSRSDPATDTGLFAIQKLIDLALADKPSEEVEANLYSARIHIVRAIKEVA
jgi:hypothetical protein